jgi:hypothetical protein
MARVGMRHSERYLVHFLRSNTSVTGVLPELAIPPEEHPATLRALARQVWQTGLVCVPVDGIAVREAEDEGVTDIAGKEEIEVLDLVAVEFAGKKSRWESNVICSATLCLTGTSLILEMASRPTSTSAQRRMECR